MLYSDMDAFRHLNNGVTGRYFEEGRADLNMRVFGERCMVDPPEGLQLLFATVTIDFHPPGVLPRHGRDRRRHLEIGGSFYVIAQAAFQSGECFALTQVVMVKAINGRPTALTDHERHVLQSIVLAYADS